LEEQQMIKSLAAACAVVAMSLTGVASAQEAAERPTLMGLSPQIQDLLIEADKKSQDPGLQGMLKAAREGQLAALEADPLDLGKLVRALEAEEVVAGLLLDKKQDALLEAYVKMTPAERKTYANSSRKFDEARDALKAKPAEASKK
jgi:hypothetical protein